MPAKVMVNVASNNAGHARYPARGLVEMIWVQ
uniref:Uncharacterized protein n=1 Tax=Rhizophora mucronata TaxID=61149 RepID=A0A2P2QRE0_RHIMU